MANRNRRLAPGADPRLDRLRAEVLGAVRGAVAQAMAGKREPRGLAKLDLDFSLATEPNDQWPNPFVRLWRNKSRAVAVLAVSAGLALAGFAAGLAVTLREAEPGRTPTVDAAPPVPTPADALAAAQALAAHGSLRAARALLAPLAARQPAAAELLARTYDPRGFAALPAADAPADAAQARFWYRGSFALAAAAGQAPDPAALAEVLRGLEEAPSARP